MAVTYVIHMKKSLIQIMVCVGYKEIIDIVKIVLILSHFRGIFKKIGQAASRARPPAIVQNLEVSSFFRKSSLA